MFQRYRRDRHHCSASYHARVSRHTYKVEVSLGDLESALGEVGRNRVAYVSSGADDALANFTAPPNASGRLWRELATHQR